MLISGKCHEAYQNSKQLIDGFLPDCNEDGSYKPKQCTLGRLLYWCANIVTGVKVPGTEMIPIKPKSCLEYKGNLYYTNSNNSTATF